MGILSRVSLARAQLQIEALLTLMYLGPGCLRAHPLLGWSLRPLGQSVDVPGPGGPEKKLFDPYPLCGKRVRSAWEGELSGTILVGKDRDRGPVSHDVTWRCVVAGSEIKVDSCPSRIRRPYKTMGFAPRVPYFASLPSHLQPPPPTA